MRKRLLWLIALLHASSSAWAASSNDVAYPIKPMRLLDGFAAGGGSDYVARVIGVKMTDRLGQTVIVENRPGAGSNLAAEITARANPDGYTLMLASSALPKSPGLYPNLGYDLMKDFAYVGLAANTPFVLITTPSLSARTLQELIAHARAKPKSITYGSSGVGGGGHLATELLLSRARVEIPHIPYKGAAPAVVGLMSGEVQIVFGSIASAMSMIRTKRVNALAVTGLKRVGALPDVPTIAESGFPGYDVTTNYGIISAAGTPASVVNLLNSELRAVVQMDDVKEKLASQGMEPVTSTPAEHRAIMQSELALWTKVIKDAGITAN